VSRDTVFDGIRPAGCPTQQWMCKITKLRAAKAIEAMVPERWRERQLLLMTPLLHQSTTSWSAPPPMQYLWLLRGDSAATPAASQAETNTYNKSFAVQAPMDASREGASEGRDR